jgi:hypothetical protein
MSVAYSSAEIIALEPKIKYAGVFEGGNIESNFNDPSQTIDNSIAKLSLTQTPHIIESGERFSKELGKLEYIAVEYEKLMLFDVPAKDKIITFATTKDIDNKEIIKTISNRILNPQKDDMPADENMTPKNNYSNPWKNYMLEYIELFKEFTINSIYFNEKTIKSFWRNIYGEQSP